jgi:hypothetical protein
MMLISLYSVCAYDYKGRLVALLTCARQSRFQFPASFTRESALSRESGVIVR